MKSPQEQELRAQVEQVREKLQGLAADLRVVDDTIEGLAPQRTHHELLEQACSSLEKLDATGIASLFWGERIEPARVAEQLREVRTRVSAFRAKLDELDEQRQLILAAIGLEEENLEVLGEDIHQVRSQEERKKLEWIVERDVGTVRHLVRRMAWTRGGEEDKRFHKSLTASLLISALFGALLPMIDLPLPERFVPDQLPRRLAQLVRQEQAKLVPPPPVVAETPTDQQEPDPVEEPDPLEEPDQARPDTPVLAEAAPVPSERPGQPGPEAPTVAEAKPRRRVQKAGILAFRDKFASLSQDDVAPRLGANARYGDADDASTAASPSRSMLTSNAPGSSGGINLAALSRNVGGGGGGGDGNGAGGGGGIQGVPLGRATSSIAGIGGGGGGGRPLASGGPGASRTDEEIQIVFDRYKAAFYRLYNRELRNDPTLRGQMVLRLTIEPDGSVSECVLQSSDMDAPDLAAQVVSRVRTLDFGAKDVEAMTIVYPIDFLPAS